MSDVFRKLQFKGQERIYVKGAPAEFKRHLSAMKEVTRISTRAPGKTPFGFALFFVRNRAEIDKMTPAAAACLEDDGLLWVAYPKKSSKRYTSGIGRDAGWQALGDHGFEAVRQVAIDEDWSALRFRRVEHIKTLKRDPKRAMTAKGRKRAGTRKGR